MAGVWAPGRRLLTAGLILTVTLVASEALAVGTVMPLVKDELGDLWLYGWVFSAFFLGDLVGIVIAGRASDRIHPAGPFTAGLVLFAVGLFAAAIAPTMALLVFARLLQGVGAGALPATAYVCIARAYPAELRPRMFALLSTAWVVPALVGPALAALIGETVGWRWVFGSLIPLVGVAGVAAVRAVRRSVPGTSPSSIEGSRTVRDAVLVALAAASTLAGLSLEVRLAGVAISLVAIAVGIPVYRRLTPAGTLRAEHGLPAAVLLRGFLTCAFFATDVFVPLAIVDVRGGSTAVVAVALAAATLAWTAGAWVQERQVYRMGPQRLVRLGFGGLLCSLGLLGIGLTASAPMVVIPAAFALAGISMGPAYAAISVTVLALAPSGGEGSASSALQLTDVLGVALGTGVAGALVALGEDLDASLAGGIAAVFAFSGAVALIGLSLARRLPLRLPTIVPPSG